MQELTDEIKADKLFTIDSTYRTATNDYVDQKYEPSEVILLGVVSINKQYDGVIEWSSKHRTLIKNTRSQS